MSFSFKQFTVFQDNCAMKVCTDACLFGAWVAELMADKDLKIKKVLDIGTGTGLLSLMLAQKINSGFDAVEINADAALQAADNFAASPWKNRLQLHHSPVQGFKHAHLYSLIISNPPFFKNDLRSADAHKNAAKHEGLLSLQELFFTIDQCLESDGYAAILLPFDRRENAIDLAGINGLFLQEEMQVKQTPNHDRFRSMLLFSRQQLPSKISCISIHDANRNYTPPFVALLKDYYLKL